ncbi:LuxR family transcriptional regulator [Paenibacillus sp. MY03]|jgi:hypothetical protein|uniref:GIY-YIG nuclease family protein n=1 Tax=Paenibacillus sp. MY03 TaxID=302980 RepID=UPI000B3CA033|nr:GIY-YIG nuclease family protein [Paenibacillus sp. MY03]OUS68798.1 LuxR family transcriptional regulator [Paenibacillus sp. MY03]
MDRNRRKELQEAYKEMKTYMGVVQIKNKESGKLYIASYPNLKNKWPSIKTQLEMGRFKNLELQKDWRELGEAAFAFDILEQKDASDITDIKWALKQLEKPWLQKLQPYGEKGYNKPPRE